MLAHPTLDQLHTLGLHGLAKGFKELEHKPEARALQHAEWLGLLLEYELTLRRQKQFETRARVAKLRHSASVEDVNYQTPRGLDRALFLKLSACDWIAERRNLLVTGARHGLFGQVLPIVGLRSARGPKFVMVRLPDGRRRSIPRSITNLAAEPFTQVNDSIEESLRISVRTLLPLAYFLTARSTSLEEIGDERAASPDADALDHAGSGAVGAESAPAPALEEALRDRQAAVSLRRRRHGQAGGDKRSKGAT